MGIYNPTNSGCYSTNLRLIRVKQKANGCMRCLSMIRRIATTLCGHVALQIQSSAVILIIVNRFACHRRLVVVRGVCAGIRVSLTCDYMGSVQSTSSGGYYGN